MESAVTKILRDYQTQRRSWAVVDFWDTCTLKQWFTASIPLKKHIRILQSG